MRRDRRILFGKMSVDFRITWICCDRRSVSEIVDVFGPDYVRFRQTFWGTFSWR
jgi:hypothetical protein